MTCSPGDPSYNSTVLLYHCDEANGATAFTDNSFIATGGTATGATATTAQFKFGTASANYANASGRIISSAAASNFNLGSGKFTVECWARTTGALTGGQTYCLLGQLNGGGQFGWRLNFLGNDIRFLYSTTGSDAFAVNGAYTPTIGNWVFYAADRDASNVVRVYADGVVINSATVASTIFASTAPLVVGNDATLGSGFVGQIDDARITKGVARYAGAFTPPTAAFPNQLASVGCGGGGVLFRGVGSIAFPSPGLVAALAGARAIMRNKPTTRRGLLRPW